jgi:uncharacterized membrane-anchored protein
MSRRTQLLVAGVVTLVMAVATALALKDAGVRHGLWAFLITASWFAGPLIGVKVVQAFHPHEIRGRVSRALLVVVIVALIWFALFFWNAVLAPPVGLDCVSTLNCPLWQVVLTVLGQAAVVFLASFAGASLVARFQARGPRS